MNDPFGYYLSGFIDGEGSFCLSIYHRDGRPQPRADFRIVLRQDDLPILQRIKEFWKCGHLFKDKRDYKYRSDGFIRGLRMHYFINNPEHLTYIVLPHFQQYPLLANKANDVPIFAQGVRMLLSHRRGSAWRQDDIARFQSLIDQLSAGRRTSKNIPLAIPDEPPALPLFG